MRAGKSDLACTQTGNNNINRKRWPVGTVSFVVAVAVQRSRRAGGRTSLGSRLLLVIHLVLYQQLDLDTQLVLLIWELDNWKLKVVRSKGFFGMVFGRRDRVPSPLWGGVRILAFICEIPLGVPTNRSSSWCLAGEIDGIVLALHKFAIRLRPVESRFPYSFLSLLFRRFRSSFPRQLDWCSDPSHSAGLVQTVVCSRSGSMGNNCCFNFSRSPDAWDGSLL